MKGNKIIATLIVLAMVMSTMVVLDKLDITTEAAYVPGTDTPGRDEFGNATKDLTYGVSYADQYIKINTT